jgi:hypothetical protein
MSREMKCPVTCSLCGDLIELADAVFYTDLCDCPTHGSCSHGVCHDCAVERDDEPFEGRQDD